MGNLITGVISITVGAIMLANVFMANVKATNQTGAHANTSHIFNCSQAPSGNCSFPNAWSTSEIAMWSLLGLVGVVGLVYGVLNVFGLA